MSVLAVSRLLCLVLVGGSCAGCGGKNDRTDASTDFEPNKSLFADIAKSDHLTLYEGLPHQGNERKLFEQEKRDKTTMVFQGFPFYATPLEVAADEVAQLRGELGSADLFRPWAGEKKCGGFHPDYLAEWRSGETTCRVLICFGCSEVKVFGPGRTLRCDIEFGAKKKLEGLLKKYRKNRPASEES